MLTIISMCMIVNPAKPEIQKMGGNNQKYCRYQQPGSVMNKKLFHDQENKTGGKKRYGKPAVMVFFIAMMECQCSNQ